MTKKQKKMLIRILLTAVLVIILVLLPIKEIWGGWLRFGLFLIPYFLIGYDILRKAAKSVINRQPFDECFLMAIATIGAIILGEYVEGVAVMLFYQIGELFQSYAVGKSRRSISDLMDIRPDYANIETEDGHLEQVDPDEVEVGTIIVVQPGEKIPIDGVVTEGASTLNTSALTGESLPREVAPGDEVVSGCINQSGLLHIKTTRLVNTLADTSDIIVLAVKPQVLPQVVEKIQPRIRPEQIVISIAAGISMKELTELMGEDKKIVRVMSNTPAMVGAAMTGVVLNDNVTNEEGRMVLDIFKALGRAELIDEYLMDAVVGISGSSPAYVYMFINALAEGAVREGMSKNQAYIFAAQAVLGSAKMVLESGMHPGELIDMVTSPGGTTIEAIGVLEHNAFSATVIDAVHAAAEKNRQMAEK